jgi:hypothetical protein
VDKDLPYSERLPAARVRCVLGERAGELVIVPGDHVVVARCGSCGTCGGNPRGFADVRFGGARAPTRARARRARVRRGVEETGRGAEPAARLPAGPERPGGMRAAQGRGLGRGLLQCRRGNQRVDRAGRLGGPRGLRREGVPEREKTHDCIYRYHGYWSEGDRYTG